MNLAYICDPVRTPVGRYGGVLSGVRPDDLAAAVIREVVSRNSKLDPSAIDEVILGCANQAGEDNRNIARMSLLIAGLPWSIPGMTVNRLCASGMEAISVAAQLVSSGNASVIIAGGVESMSRAPYVMEKPSEGFSRNPKIYDTTLGWRFVNSLIDKIYGTDSMMETAENLAAERGISREDQDLFAWRSQEKAIGAIASGAFASEIVQVATRSAKGEETVVSADEHPRKTSVEKLATLKPLSRTGGTVTAGNSSGINDGAAAMIIASEGAVKKFGLKPLAVIRGYATAGVPPRIMGIGPVPATGKLLARLSLKLSSFGVIELNEAFAAQALACTRELGLADSDPRVNRLGGAIALGHPLGMSGARLVTTATYQMHHFNEKMALCTMCVGVGQGVAMALEKV